MAEPNFNDLRSEFAFISIPLDQSPTDDPPLDAAIILFVITFFVTSYRCFARYKKGLWWHDDSVALFSMLFFITFPVGSCYF
jgi:hypothetical protein